MVAAFFSLLYNNRNLHSKIHENIELRALNLAQKITLDEIVSETEMLLSKMMEVEQLSNKVAESLGIHLEEENGEELLASNSLQHSDNPRHYTSRQGPIMDRVHSNISGLQRLLPQQYQVLEELREEVDEYRKRMDSTPSIWPTWGSLTSGFGMRRSPFYPYHQEFHKGVDIANAPGTPIYATASGTVSFCGFRGGYGNTVMIRHGYGFSTLYAHLTRIDVAVGQNVNKGQVIGTMGRTGSVTGSHLHYEVHINGVPVNPRNYMR